MVDYNDLRIPIDYDSPINFITQMADAIGKFTDDGVMKAVVRDGFDIDRDKLIQALQQDKERYEEAYRRGFNAGFRKRDEPLQPIVGEAEDMPGFAWYVCPGCKIGVNYLDKYCSHCGQALKWDDPD